MKGEIPDVPDGAENARGKKPPSAPTRREATLVTAITERTVAQGRGDIFGPPALPLAETVEPSPAELPPSLGDAPLSEPASTQPETPSEITPESFHVPSDEELLTNYLRHTPGTPLTELRYVDALGKINRTNASPEEKESVRGRIRNLFLNPPQEKSEVLTERASIPIEVPISTPPPPIDTQEPLPTPNSEPSASPVSLETTKPDTNLDKISEADKKIITERLATIVETIKSLLSEFSEKLSPAEQRRIKGALAFLNAQVRSWPQDPSISPETTIVLPPTVPSETEQPILSTRSPDQAPLEIEHLPAPTVPPNASSIDLDPAQLRALGLSDDEIAEVLDIDSQATPSPIQEVAPTAVEFDPAQLRTLGLTEEEIAQILGSTETPAQVPAENTSLLRTQERVSPGLSELSPEEIARRARESGRNALAAAKMRERGLPVSEILPPRKSEVAASLSEPSPEAVALHERNLARERLVTSKLAERGIAPSEANPRETLRKTLDAHLIATIPAYKKLSPWGTAFVMDAYKKHLQSLPLPDILRAGFRDASLNIKPAANMLEGLATVQRTKPFNPEKILADIKNRSI